MKILWLTINNVTAFHKSKEEEEEEARGKGKEGGGGGVSHRSVSLTMSFFIYINLSLFFIIKEVPNPQNLGWPYKAADATPLQSPPILWVKPYTDTQQKEDDNIPVVNIYQWSYVLTQYIEIEYAYLYTHKNRVCTYTKNICNKEIITIKNNNNIDSHYTPLLHIYNIK